MSTIRRLLVMSCSATKRKDTELLAAIDRYDGPAFRILRNHLPQTSNPPQVLILSAKYGLIEATREIPDYELRLTVESAQAIRGKVLRVLAGAFNQTSFTEVAFFLGKVYQVAIDGYQDVIPAGTTVTFISGGQGVRLRNLRLWLANDSSSVTEP